MKKRYWLGLGLLAAIGAAAFMLPRLVSVDKAKALVATQVREHTGRELVMSGPAEVGFFPNVSLRLEQVSLSSPAGFGQEPMLDIPVLTTSFALLPLLSGELQLQNFTLERPVIRLEKKANGQANWEFHSPTAAKVEKAADQDSPAAEASTLDQLKKLQLGDLRLLNATVFYKDAASGISEQLVKLNLLIEAPDLTEALAVDISTLYRGKEVTLTLDSSSPLKLLQGGKLPLTFEAALPETRIHYEGNARLQDGQPMTDGQLQIKADDLPALLSWLNPSSQPSPSIPDRLELASPLTADAGSASLSALKLSSDRLSATGSLKAEWSGKRPKIDANLTVPEVTIDDWLPQENSPQANLFLLFAPAYAQEKVLAPSEPWDNSPLDLGFLQALDADIAFKAERLTYRDLTVEQAPIDADLRGGVLTLQLPGWNLASGIANLNARLDASRPQTQWSLEGGLANVQSETLLKTLAKTDRLSGKANASWQLSGQGRSLQQWMQSINGKTSLRFNDGAIKGIDLAGMVRNLQGAIDPSKPLEVGRQQTDFAELSADFTVKDGTAHTDNLQMLAPFARLSGTGDVYLPRKELRFEVTPKAVASIKGQGGEADAKGLYVPFVIKGTFDDLAFYPKVGNLLKDALKDPARLQELKDNVKGIKDIKNNLKDMFGGF